MALRQIMIAKKIEQRNVSLSELLEKQSNLDKRTSELEVAIDEAKTDEEIATVEEETEKLEADQKELDKSKTKLESEIADLESELEKLNSNDPAPNERSNDKKAQGGTAYMRTGKFFGGMTREALVDFVHREEVKSFLERTRSLIGQKRAITGADLTIPEVMLDLLRDNLHKYSKLISKVRLKPVPGKARQNIAGTIPEGVWTEAIGKLNELKLEFNQVEVDGYKVGGFIPIPNSILEDSELNLANEILQALGQAIGLAVDKAICYGTGVKMPLGIAKRLAQTAEPTNWGSDAPPWTDLHTKNLLKIDASSMTAVEFYAALILKLGVAEPKYSNGKTFWAMNRQTKMTLLSKALSFNAAGALVSSQLSTMPVESGDIVELDFVPDGDIIGGFGSLYLLAERAGAQLASSQHVRFIEDQTVFKGTARYDGAPARGEGFVVININNIAPTTSVPFAADNANP
ncbi:phage major capsid protein [Clostridium sp. 'deep sea']|uniref:phage major capsid protein n=1 Tax=Clostridium sp. 'deep sea' TaxID=2779445 RepID=UPI0018966529|nr:phage major capsid protein [Clostridium sp. 'deep sea']QOR34438.1 phage major capsid protein [Clostridium sp. 'deep sea']